jgi:hypothetical protein
MMALNRMVKENLPVSPPFVASLLHGSLCVQCVVIDSYEFIIADRNVEGIPSLQRAGSMAS